MQAAVEGGDVFGTVSEKVMYVQLNFEGAASLRRTFSADEQLSDYSLIEAGIEKPMTSDEYKDQIKQMRLSVTDFCIYQDRLLSFTKQNLNEIFERLSGSVDFKTEYDRLAEHKLAVEQQLREVSEQLKEKRHEKVKVKGLGEYQK